MTTTPDAKSRPHRAAAVVLVAGNAAVDENIVVQLHAEHQERRPREGRTLPAVA